MTEKLGDTGGGRRPQAGPRETGGKVEMTAKSKVLIVDDDPRVRGTLSDVLKLKGHAPLTAATGKEALERIETESPAVALIDLKLEDMSGLELMKEMRRRSLLDTACIIITGYTSQESVIEAMNLGAYSYMRKPYDMDQLLLTIRRAIEKGEAEERLRKSEERFRALFEQSRDAIYVTTRAGRFAGINQSMLDLFGYSREEMLELDVRRIYADAADRDTFQQEIEEKGSVKDYEVRFLKKDGAQMDCLLTATLRRAEDGSILGYQGVIRDITERKKAEEALRASEEFNSSLMKNAPIPLLVANPDSSLRYVNPALTQLTGFSPAELLGKKAPYPWGTEETLEKTGEGFEQAMRQGARRVEQLFQKKNGERFWVEISATPSRQKGQFNYYVANWLDITERKKAQQRLEDAFVDLTETVSRAMETRDPYTSGHQRKVAALARLVGEKLGLSADELQGLYIGSLLHDIGKISVPESILTRPGRLTAEEWSLIQVHASQGHEILKETTLPWPVAEMALHHHERLDGSGYPEGLSGDELSQEVRILGLCDVVEAMSSHRPYRPARSREEVLKEIEGGRGTKYDARVVEAMLEIIEGGALEPTQAKQ